MPVDQWATIKINGVAMPGAISSFRYYGLPYCKRCLRRQMYTACSKCGADLCALCSWPRSYGRIDDTLHVDERCRECADK
jgi:hypothetical protein